MSDETPASSSAASFHNPFVVVKERSLGLKMTPDYLEKVRRERDEGSDNEIVEEWTETQTKDAIELCDRLFDWFLNLKSCKQISVMPLPDDVPPFPIDDISITLFSPEEATEWLNMYASGMSLDDLDEKIGKDLDIVVMGIIEAIWREENKRNVDLVPLLLSAEIDKKDVKNIRNHLMSTNIDLLKTPSALCSRSVLCAVDVCIPLLIVRSQLAEWPLNIDWKKLVLRQYPREEYEAIFSNIDENVKEALENEVKIETPPADLAVEKSLAEAEASLSKCHAESNLINQDMTAVSKGMHNMKEGRQRFYIERQKGIERIYPNNLSTSPPRTPDEIEAYNAEMRDILRQKNNIFVPTNDKNTISPDKLVIFKPSQKVYARMASHDGEPFVEAVVKKRVSEDIYEVSFGMQSVKVHVDDLAHCTLCYKEEYFEGMRVAALTSHPNPSNVKTGNSLGRYSGTISNRQSSIHNHQYLVFFDDDFDEYVSRDDLAIMAKQPLDKGLIDKGAAFKFIRNSIKKRTFVEMYFRSYPDWGLVRLKKHESNQRIAVRHRNGQQWSAILLEVDRHMCLLRFPPLNSKIAGAQCVQKDCRQHFHVDERLFRGSDRFHQVQQNIETASGGLVMAGRQLARHRAQLESAVPVVIQQELNKELHKKPVARKSSVSQKREPMVPEAHTRPVVHHRRREELLLMRKNMHKFDLVEQFQESRVVEPVYHDTCSNSCLRGEDRDPADPSFLGSSPFNIPIVCGWRRLLYYPVKNGASRKHAVNRPQVVYRGPCGKPLYSMSEIAEYLKETCCEMTIDLFVFDWDIRTHVMAEVDKRYQILEDFAQGNEGIPIPAVNSVDKEPPPKIIYSSRRFAENEEVDMSTVRKEYCSGCTCTDDCRDEENCECQQLTKSLLKRLARVLRPSTHMNFKFRRLYNKLQSGLYECNDSCGCNRKTCFNRVVQQPIKIPLQLFKTAECGWGVRTLVDLPKGYFIANYNGAILTDNLADKLKDRGDEYFADLDLIEAVEAEKENCGIDLLDDKGIAELQGDSDNERNDREHSDGYSSQSDEEEREKKKSKAENNQQNEPEQSDVVQPPGFGAQWNIADYFLEKFLFIVDAKKRGNIGRFLNHSCEPNVYVQHVFVDTHDLRLPWVSFFTSKSVKAGEELRWDYSYHVDDSSEVRMHCNCGSKNCRGRLL